MRRTRPLTASAVWPRAARAAARRDVRLLLAFDVDGTLAPIVTRPNRARVPRSMLRLLARAAGLPGAAVAVISARRDREVKRLVPVRGIRRAALYGLEGTEARAGARRWDRPAEHLARLLDPLAREFRGAWIERKRATVAVHVRSVARSRLAAVTRAVTRASAEARGGFAVVRGHCTIEFVPRGHDKGRALRALRRRTRPHRVFYFGDSEADEPAFAALRREDFSVRVGAGPTRARYRVGGPAEVRAVLRVIVSLRAGETLEKEARA